jgi:hypothetical protein
VYGRELGFFLFVRKLAKGTIAGQAAWTGASHFFLTLLNKIPPAALFQ